MVAPVQARHLGHRDDPAQARLHRGVGGAGLRLVRASPEHGLAQDIARNQTAPQAANHVAGVLGKALVTVLAGRRDDGDVLVPHLVQHVPEIRRILPKPAGPLGCGHEEGRLVSVEVVALDNAEKVAKGQLLGVAFLAAGVQRAEQERPVVGLGHDGGVNAYRTKDRRGHLRTDVRHPRNPDRPTVQHVCRRILSHVRNSPACPQADKKTPPTIHRSPDRQGTLVPSQRLVDVRPAVGIEPTTPALQKPCSTVELRWQRTT